MTLQLVVFDCDGVMFDSLESNRAYYNDMLRRFGKPDMDEGELGYVHTHNVLDAVAHIFRRHRDIAPERVDAHRAGLDYTPYLSSMRIEPDLKDFLGFLKPRYRTAISTNRTTTLAAIMATHGLGPWFDKVVTAMDVARPKPAPDALHDILEYFGLDAAEAIFIGDSEVDREHAASVGMPLIAFRNRALAAEYHVNSFMEITRLRPFLAG